MLKQPDLKAFFVYTAIMLLIMALAQYAFLPNIDHDELEGLRWGATGAWLDDKHPPLLGFVLRAWVNIFGFNDLAVYMSSKVNALIGLWTVYLVSRQFVDRTRAVLSAATYSCTYPFILMMTQFDANSILFALWPLTALFFWRAYTDGRLADWLLAGLFMGLGVLGKYHSVLLGLSLLGYLLAMPRGRAHFRTAGPWLGAALSLLIVSPHVVALAAHDWAPISNISVGLGGSQEPLTGRASALSFLLVQLVYGALGFWFLVIQQRIWRPREKGMDEARWFLVAIGLVFPLLPVAVALLMDVTLLPNWGMNAWFLFPALILAFWPERRGRTYEWRALLAGIPVYLAIFVGVNTVKFVGTIQPEPPIAAIIREAEAWFTQNGHGVPVLTVTNARQGQGMTFYSNAKTMVAHQLPLPKYTWILDENGCAPGPVLVLATDSEGSQAYVNAMRNLLGPSDGEATVSVPAGRVRLANTRAFSLKAAAWRGKPCIAGFDP